MAEKKKDGFWSDSKTSTGLRNNLLLIITVISLAGMVYSIFKGVDAYAIGSLSKTFVKNERLETHIEEATKREAAIKKDIKDLAYDINTKMDRMEARIYDKIEKMSEIQTDRLIKILQGAK